MADVLPAFAGGDDDVVTFVQNAGGYEAWKEALGDRLIPGFAGAAGTFVDGGLEYRVAPRWAQPTTISDVDPDRVRRVRERVREVLEHAGFPVAVCDRMDAWQRWHAAWILVSARGVQRVAGDLRAMADRRHIRSMVGALHEGAAAAASGGYPPPSRRTGLVVSSPEVGPPPRARSVGAAPYVRSGGGPQRAHSPGGGERRRGADPGVGAVPRPRDARPISKFQNTRFKLAECATEVEVGRAFLDRLIQLHREGEYLVKECSMAKLWLSMRWLGFERAAIVVVPLQVPDQAEQVRIMCQCSGVAHQG
jgi:hypothetical protein